MRDPTAGAPAWSLNLKANPHVEREVRGEHRQVRERVAVGDERAALWETMNARFEGLGHYAHRPRAT